ncbi:MAG TPA: OsmC family peroxiredoxin [Gaiellales bacterium]|jgi:osmotically inducible protein OsmC|nr:OsmC family peroxiredoxin [Gaiellales bacterium]
MAESRASALWQGDLGSGSGKVSVASGAFPEQAVTWKARTERPDPKTSPEELIAAAHAACYAMAFSHTLAEAGHAPEQVAVDAACQFGPIEGGGFAITRIDLTVRGRVPGIDQAEFERLAGDGERGCPVSNALRGNVEIGLAVTLES